jgi:hypothetical protein
MGTLIWYDFLYGATGYAEMPHSKSRKLPKNALTEQAGAVIVAG